MLLSLSILLHFHYFHLQRRLLSIATVYSCNHPADKQKKHFNFTFYTESQYHRMPKLWQMDDYDECLESPGPGEPPGVYCGLSVVLKPNNRSELWKLIEVLSYSSRTFLSIQANAILLLSFQEFSSDYKRHYNHQVLKWGVCIKRCQKAIEKLLPAERNALTVEPFPIDVRV